jgi:NAD(P)-dependent dehydrogenase (short-subunit alcohol dehydrogenase family)
MSMTRESAIVVGVGAGLGAALVRCFAGEGFRVYAAARSASRLGTLMPGSAGEVIAVDCDATSPAGVAALFARVEAETGSPDLVVHNVGAYQRGVVADLDPADFERAWRGGCFAGFLVAQAAARSMRKAGRGTILFTGATASLRGRAGFSALASPKAALRALAQSMARELGPENIHVAHVIIDGGIRSERYAALAAANNLGPDALLDPDVIAGNYLMLHRQQRSAWTQELDLRPWVEKF